MSEREKTSIDHGGKGRYRGKGKACFNQISSLLTCLSDILLLCRQGRHYIARGFLTKMKPDVKYLKFLYRTKLVVYGQKIDARQETENSQVSNWNFYCSFRHPLYVTYYELDYRVFRKDVSKICLILFFWKKILLSSLYVSDCL